MGAYPQTLESLLGERPSADIYNIMSYLKKIDFTVIYSPSLCLVTLDMPVTVRVKVLLLKLVCDLYTFFNF